ncbi:MAG: DUF4405 domain-containing protein [Phycisphaeraceae bacterium]
MKRVHIHLLLDVGLALGALGLLWTGLLLVTVLPQGSRQATVWGLGRHDWGDIHFWIAVTMVGLLLVHLALNWAWVCNVTLKLLGQSPRDVRAWRRQLLGVGVLIVLAAGIAFSLWLAATVKHEDPGPPRDGRGRIERTRPAAAMPDSQPALHGIGSNHAADRA